MGTRSETKPFWGPGPIDAVKNFSKTFTKFGRHDVVEDGIDGRVDVEHDAAKVE